MHAHIEVRKGPQWFHFAAPIIPQNYIFYAAVNGEGLKDFRESIRNRIQPQASQRGMPFCMSEVTVACYQQDKKDYQLHGEGCLHAKDLEKLQQHLWEINEFDPKAKWDLEEQFFHTYIGGNALAAHDGWDDVRVIFWYSH